ncbi:hypothetical protein ERX27_10400 [Macrococcus brunensis]|uniref:Uncharacterized protein n=1 Tax=Macrococcus brunensis TaxID=198483 RepID=A0A4R6BAU3_9STAP|nr:hypothetical protein [Macrococcus brunensis]TDL93423.1 hypothetical protein ERX27_10400 [Macrococcus brunensis]
MKKVVYSVVATSLLATSLSATSFAAEKTKVSVPDLKNKEVVKQLKQGTYSVNGVKLGTLYGQAKEILGTPENEYESRNSEGVILSADYKKVGLSGDSVNRKENINNIRINSLSFYDEKKPVKFKDISAALGKYTSTELYDNGTKSIKDDFLFREYNHLAISFERTTGEWVATGFSVNEKETTPVNHSKLADAEIKMPTTKQILAMKNNAFTLFGVKPGMSRAEVIQTIGESSSDDVYREKGIIKRIDSAYGENMGLNLKYNVPAGNKVKAIIFNNNSEEQIKLSSYEKVLGRATYEKKSSFEEEVNNKMYKIDTITRKYGKHLTIKAEKRGKEYKVVTVSYQ